MENYRYCKLMLKLKLRIEKNIFYPHKKRIQHGHKRELLNSKISKCVIEKDLNLFLKEFHSW